MDEHRNAPRHRVLKSAMIEFGGGGIDCVVRNMSDTGAALEVTSPLGIPERFSLVITQERQERQERLVKPCRVMWRKEKRIGVRFVGEENSA